MVIVRPFKGVRYELEKVLLKQVIAPPYDVISPEYRESLVARSSYNVVNIDLPIGEDKYLKAAQTFDNWRVDGILKKEADPAFYIYEQEYTYNGKSYVRTGFVGLLKLSEFGKGMVHPHEKTLSGPKQDRFELMKACKANFSQIFGLYIDEDDSLSDIFESCQHTLPVESAIDDELVKHTIWAIKDEKSIDYIQRFMKDKEIYIADGHHRYETAINYRDYMREKKGDDPAEIKPYDFVMMMFVNFFDSGLMLFPTHRVIDLPAGATLEKLIEDLKSNFTLVELEASEDGSNEQKYLDSRKEPGSMVLVTNDKVYGITLHQEELDALHAVYRNIDTYLLEKKVLEDKLKISEEQILAKEGIYFYQNIQEMRKYIAQNNGVGFFMKSIPAEMVRHIAENGLVMPQKSTYFYPKLATGLLFNEL